MITDFTHEVTLAEDRCRRLLDTLRTLELVDIYRFPERGEEMTTTAALQAEMLTCHLRNILFDAAGASPSSYYASAFYQHSLPAKTRQYPVSNAGPDRPLRRGAVQSIPPYPRQHEPKA